MPVFDHPWGGRHWSSPAPELIVRNASDIDAFRISLVPINLGNGVTLGIGSAKVHSWPIVIRYSNADGQWFEDQWQLQNDIESCRVRIVGDVRGSDANAAT